jgi:hypothetical protein
VIFQPPESKQPINQQKEFIMKTRNGKIAHLPFQIREELNIRLANGEPGNKLVEWLNTHPAVIEVMNNCFGGRPVSEQNLSEWRNGGYEQWAMLNACLGETTGLSESAGLIAENGIDTRNLLLVITAHYAGMIQRWNITPVEDLDRMMSVFKSLTNAVLAVRRSEQRDARLEIDRERLEILREKRASKSASSASSPASTSGESPSPSQAPSGSPADHLSAASPSPEAAPTSQPAHPHPKNAAAPVPPVPPVPPVLAQNRALPPTTPPSRPIPSATHPQEAPNDAFAALPGHPSSRAGRSPAATSPQNPVGSV